MAQVRKRKVRSKGKWRRGHRLAFACTVCLWIGTIAFIVWTVDVYGRFYSAWSRHRAQLEIAHNVLEDPISAYDSLLGWKHIPGKVVPMDAAFPGESIIFEINNNGFRGSQDYSKTKPDGIVRIVAVGRLLYIWQCSNGRHMARAVGVNRRSVRSHQYGWKRLWCGPDVSVVSGGRKSV